MSTGTATSTRGIDPGPTLTIESSRMEQRKGQRFDLKLPFELIRSDPGPKHGETKNVSSSGVLFQSDASLRIGEPVEYMITLPQARLRCVGKVVRFARESEVAATLERYEFVR